MPPFDAHPSLDALHDHLAADGADDARVAAHLARCARCRESLRFLRTLDRDLAAAPAPAPPAALRDRILASRAGGVRTLLPLADAAPRGRVRRRVLRLAAAGLALATVGALLTGTTEGEAGTTVGTLTLTPAAPRPGQTITVHYRPAALLAARPWLAVRARLRAPSGESYNAGVPVVTVATLRRGADDAFTGTFTLPDSVVFAALAVEDSGGRTIDDNGSRAWELLVADAKGRPLISALDQRAHDLMGRNWEEGYATARRMVALHPDELRAWSWLRSFEHWLGRADEDSLLARHRARVAAVGARLAAMPTPDPATMGRLAWYARGVDSAAAERWQARLLREAPRDEFAIQWRLFGVLDTLRASSDTAVALRRLDALWHEAAPHRALQIANYATSISWGTGDTALIRRWTDRAIAGERDHRAAARWVASRYADTPALRAEGMARLRAELAALRTLPASARALGETSDRWHVRRAADERALLASLGRALVAAGQQRAGLDTLALAAASGWDLRVLRAVRTARSAAGDHAGALDVAALIAADPRTPAAFADTARGPGDARVRDDDWQARVSRARATFAARMLEHAPKRGLPGAIPLRDLDGRPHDLRTLARGRVTVVAFWSRFCQPAIDELPELGRVAARLERDGVRVVSVVEEAGTTPALRDFLRERRVALPTYLDAAHEATRAFNSWGTPNYYVLDADGQVWFEATSSAREALARAEALRLTTARTAAR
jgi:thiol-disulfide isomerase/thioredoxin